MLEFPEREEMRGDRLLVAAGRSPRGRDIGLESVGVEPGERGEVPVDSSMRVADGVWAIGDATGVWPLTYVGKYQGRVAAANILGESREANYDGRAAGDLHRPPVRIGGRGRGGGPTATGLNGGGAEEPHLRAPGPMTRGPAS